MAKGFIMAKLKELLDIHEITIIKILQTESKTWNQTL